MKKKHKILIGAGVVVAAAGGFAFSRRGPKPTPVEVAAVGREDLQAKVTANGKVQAQRKVDISATIPGQITHLAVREGEILARVRRVIGKELPLVASLDLHANVTPAMVEHADALIAYRTYPHVDMAETGRAAARHLALLLDSKQRLAKAFRQLPFLIPISWQCTSDAPCKAPMNETSG